VARAQRSEHRIADVSAHAGRRVAVTAKADVVRQQSVVILELAAACMREHGLLPVEVVSHPEDVEVADLVVGSALSHSRGFEFDGQRTFQMWLEPQRDAGGNVDVEHAVRSADLAGLLGFDVPVLEAAEIIFVEQLA
jgi:hypothetical protein